MLPGRRAKSFWEAAQQVFLERVYCDATIRDICKRAEVNIALVNYHFGDKFGRSFDPAATWLHNPSRCDMSKARCRPCSNSACAGSDVCAQQHAQSGSAFDKFLQQERLRLTPAMEYPIALRSPTSILSSIAQRSKHIVSGLVIRCSRVEVVSVNNPMTALRR
jgi:hypothetical protein